MKKVTRTDRGWAGLGSDRCKFRRNTLLECGDTKVVVSTVGLMDNCDGHRFIEIGVNRHYETMAFYSDPNDTRYHDADVSRNFPFDSDWAISELDADDRANDMHEKVVSEITEKLATDGDI